MFIFKSISSSSYFSKLFLYFTITVVICVLISSSILFVNFEKASVSMIHSSIKDSLNQISYSTNYMIDTAKVLALQVYYDNLLKKLLQFTNLDKIDIKFALDKLNSINNTTSFVHSIYLYNSNINGFYITGETKVIDENGFFDKEALLLLKEQTTNRMFKPIARSIPAYNNTPVYNDNSNVYTFIYTEYPSNPGHFKSAVIINIHDYWVRNIIDSISLNTLYEVFVINKKGVIVSSSYKDKMLKDISHNSYIEKILTADIPSGYFTDDINGNKNLITYVNSDSTGWIYIQVTPYKIITEKIDIMRKTVFLTVLLIFIAGLVMSVYMSRKLYIPYKHVNERLVLLEDEKRNNFQLQVQQFLRNIVLNTAPYSDEEIEKTRQTFNINLDFNKPVFLVMFKIKYYHEFCDKNKSKDRSILKNGILNIACELFESLFVSEGIDMLEGHVLVVLNDPGLLIITERQKIEEVIKNVIFCVGKYLDIHLQCCISSTDSSFYESPALYTELVEVSNHFVLNKGESILWCEEINKLSPSEYIFPVDKSNLLIESIKLGNAAKSKELYLNIVNSTLEYSFNAFNTTILQLGLSLNLLIQSLNHYKSISIPFNFNGFITDITKKETIEEINKMFLDKIDYIISNITETNDPKYDELLEQVNIVIDKEYINPNLSVQMLADEVKMSPVYLGQLYKKLTTKSIHDVITEKRMEKARELLKDTYIPISEILIKCGFTNKTYFYPLFKKVHGITPVQYRKQ